MPVVVAWKLRFSASVALTIAAEVAGAQEPRDVPTFPSRTELVTVDAVVLDEQGRPARGLTAQDFALAEDGKPQEIVTFEAFDPGVGHEVAETRAALGPVATNVGSGRTGGSTFVLLVDDMSLAPSRQEALTTALGRFLADGVRTGDELIFATTSGDAWWSAHMPEGSDDLLALFARVRGRGQSDNASDAVSEWEAFRISHFESANNPNASMIQRVVDRYYERGVCQTLMPILECRSMVVARAGPAPHPRRRGALPRGQHRRLFPGCPRAGNRTARRRDRGQTEHGRAGSHAG